MDPEEMIKNSPGAQFIDHMSEAIMISAKKHLEGKFHFVLYGYEEPEEPDGDIVAALGCNVALPRLKMMLARLVLDMTKKETVYRKKG